MTQNWSMLALICLIVAGCHGPALRDEMRTSAVVGGGEAFAGPDAATAFELRHGGRLEASLAEARMAAVAKRLCSANPDLGSDWAFHVLASDQPNAFSLPSGRIYLTQALCQRRIGEDHDLLAAVIAHEMAHVALGHGRQRPCRHEAEALDREMAADRAAVSYLARAGYPSTCLADLLRLTKDLQPDHWAAARLQALGH